MGFPHGVPRAQRGPSAMAASFYILPRECNISILPYTLSCPCVSTMKDPTAASVYTGPEEGKACPPEPQLSWEEFLFSLFLSTQSIPALPSLRHRCKMFCCQDSQRCQRSLARTHWP